MLAVVVLATRAGSAPTDGNNDAAVAVADQPAATTAACTSLMAALPDQLGSSARRAVIGSPTGVAAYGDPAMVIRCGLPNPRELTCDSALVDVSGVSWLKLSDVGIVSYLNADRSVRIALSIPDGNDSGTAALQQLSSVIEQTLQQRAVCSNGTVLPADG